MIGRSASHRVMTNQGKALSWPGAPHQNHFIDNTCRILTELGLNTQNVQLTGRVMPRAGVELCIVHWPDAAFWGAPSKARALRRLAMALLNLLIIRQLGGKIVWIVHNLEPHDLAVNMRPLWRFYIRTLCSLLDGWLTLSPSTATDVQRNFPALTDKPRGVFWHPPYANAYEGDWRHARERLGLAGDRLVFGHVGLLRPYKNLAELVIRFPNIAPPEAQLLIAGQDMSNLSSCTASERVHIHPRRLSNAEFDEALTATDVFVAPYTKFLHSGALIHALSRGCVVVATHSSFASDLAAAAGRNWVVTFKGDLSAEVLAHAGKLAQDQRGLLPDLSFLDKAKNIVRLRRFLGQIGVPLPPPESGHDHCCGSDAGR